MLHVVYMPHDEKVCQKFKIKSRKKRGKLQQKKNHLILNEWAPLFVRYLTVICSERCF